MTVIIELNRIPQYASESVDQYSRTWGPSVRRTPYLALCLRNLELVLDAGLEVFRVALNRDLMALPSHRPRVLLQFLRLLLTLNPGLAKTPDYTPLDFQALA